MEQNKFCDRCGEKLDQNDYEKEFNFGFKTIKLELCKGCNPVLQKRHKKIQEKYKGKLLKLFNKYQRKLLK